jgi:hypothetical protein
MSKLTTAKRNALPKSVFGEPGRRAYPMPDKSHAANAKARASQAVNAGRMSEAEKAKIDRKADQVMRGSKHEDGKMEREHARGMEHYSHGGYGPKGHSGGKASHHGGEHKRFEHPDGAKIERKSSGEHDFHRGGHMAHDGHHDGRMQHHHRHMDHKASSHFERDGSLRHPLKIHKMGPV